MFPLKRAKLAQLRNPQNESTFFSLFIFLFLPPQKRTWFPSSSCFFSRLAILKYRSVGRVASAEGNLKSCRVHTNLPPARAMSMHVFLRRICAEALKER